MGSNRSTHVHGDGVASPKTQRDDARLSLKTTHHAQHGDQAARTARAQRMAEADGTSVKVESVVRDAQFLGDRA